MNTGFPEVFEVCVSGFRARGLCPHPGMTSLPFKLRHCRFSALPDYKKFLLYLAIDAQQIYCAHFALPHPCVPFVTTNASRLGSMMRLLDRLAHGAGSKAILCKTFPALTSIEKSWAPSGHMPTENWQRVGYAVQFPVVLIGAVVSNPATKVEAFSLANCD